MLNVAQRIDLMKLAADLAKADHPDQSRAETPVQDRVVEIFTALKAAVEAGSVLDDTDITDVKSAVDVVAGLEDLVD